jgi:uncharacterized protein
VSEPVPSSAQDAATPRPPRLGPLLGWWLALLVAVFVFQTLGFVAVGLVRMSLPPAGLGFAVSLLLAAPPSVWVIVWAARRLTGDAAGYLGRHRPRWTEALGWGAVALATTVGLEFFRRALGEPAVPTLVAEIYQSAVFLPLFWLSVGLLAPLVEEMLFRGFLLPGLAARLGPAVAVTASALLFAAIHIRQYGWVDLVVVFVLGLVFGAARWRTGSLPLAVGLHALVNLVALGHAHYMLL